MKRIFLTALCIGAIACGGSSSKKNVQTPTRGNATVLVDETLFPMMDGQVQVFEGRYQDVKFNIITAPEQLIPTLMREDSLRIGVLTRELTENERAWFDERQITPRVTPIAYDAIALIVNRSRSDSTITKSALGEILRGEKGAEQWHLVFDNPASGTVKYMTEFAGIDSLPGAYSAQSNRELLEYVASHPKAMGFTGVDWLYEADADQQQFIDKIKVLAVGDPSEGFYRPTQNDIAEGKYPFIRKVYVINCQGTTGLGLGLSAFLAGDVGQRIILKAGLVPVAYPKREIVIRKN